MFDVLLLLITNLSKQFITSCVKIFFSMESKNLAGKSKLRGTEKSLLCSWVRPQSNSDLINSTEDTFNSLSIAEEQYAAQNYSSMVMKIKIYFVLRCNRNYLYNSMRKQFFRNYHYDICFINFFNDCFFPN